VKKVWRKDLYVLTLNESFWVWKNCLKLGYFDFGVGTCINGVGPNIFVHGSFDIIHLPTQISSHFFEKIRLPDQGKSCNLEKLGQVKK
jgi:hypothetical protein